MSLHEICFPQECIISFRLLVWIINELETTDIKQTKDNYKKKKGNLDI